MKDNKKNLMKKKCNLTGKYKDSSKVVHYPYGLNMILLMHVFFCFLCNIPPKNIIGLTLLSLLVRWKQSTDTCNSQTTALLRCIFISAVIRVHYSSLVLLTKEYFPTSSQFIFIIYKTLYFKFIGTNIWLILYNLNLNVQ